jgi:hypothetical protein
MNGNRPSVIGYDQLAEAAQAGVALALGDRLAAVQAVAIAIGTKQDPFSPLLPDPTTVGIYPAEPVLSEPIAF